MRHRPPSLLLSLALLLLIFAGTGFFVSNRLGTVSDSLREQALQQANDDVEVVGHALRDDLLNFQQGDVTTLQARIDAMAGQTRIIQLVLNMQGDGEEIPILIATAPALDAADSPQAVFESINTRLAPLSQTSNALETCTGKLPIAPDTVLANDQKLTAIALQASPAGCWRILVAWQPGTAVDKLVRTLPLSNAHALQQASKALMLAGGLVLLLFIISHLRFRRYAGTSAHMTQQVPLSSVINKQATQTDEDAQAEPSPQELIAAHSIEALSNLIAAARKGLPHDTEKARLRLEAIVTDIEHIRNNLAQGQLATQSSALSDSADQDLIPLPPPPANINLSHQTTRALLPVRSLLEARQIELSPVIFPDVHIYGMATQVDGVIARMLEHAVGRAQPSDTILVRVWAQDGWAFLQTEDTKTTNITTTGTAAAAAPPPVKVHPHEYDVTLQQLARDASAMSGELVVELLVGQAAGIRVTIYLPTAG